MRAWAGLARGMDQPGIQDRRTRLVAIGAVAALVAGAVIAWILIRGDGGDRSAPPASRGGLVIDTVSPEEVLDPTKPLRCFVAGQFIGELTLTECAQRNGVATGALDVGLDETGALAAAEQAGMVLTPLPPAEAVGPGPEIAPLVQAPDLARPAFGGAAAACWRYRGGQWRRLPSDMSLGNCVQALFAGRCERPGDAVYGRWGQQTLRLVTGRVEISADNRRFRTLVEQGPGCSIPPIG